MKSMYAYTEQLDDLEIAVSELSRAIDCSKLMKNSCGIVITDFDTDIEELATLLKKEFAFPIVGCTSLATLDNEQGLRQLGMSLIVLTADDCFFEVGISDPIEGTDNEIKRETIKKFYHGLHDKHDEKEKVMITFAASGGPAWANFASDDLINTLDKESQGVPIIGGCASDDMSYTGMRVFYDGVVLSSAVTCALVYGDFKPIFWAEKSTDKLSETSWEITKCKGLEVLELDGRSVVEKFKEAGLLTGTETGVVPFISAPFLCRISTGDGDNIDVLRALNDVDIENDKADFLGHVEPGSRLTPVIMTEDTIADSVKLVLDKVLKEMDEEKNHKYETVIIISCIARYCTIVADKQIEADQVKERLPKDVTVSGFYSMGEFCPQKGNLTGKPYNIFNNETFVILAM